jgi:hypothetical protein
MTSSVPAAAPRPAAAPPLAARLPLMPGPQA